MISGLITRAEGAAGAAADALGRKSLIAPAATQIGAMPADDTFLGFSNDRARHSLPERKMRELPP